MFRFKQFSVEDNNSSMKVGTDGVLLGAWCTVSGDEKYILDIGTGSGVVALMLAQRTSESVIDAVEIEPRSAEQAAENFSASPWGDRLEVICRDVKSYAPDRKYDLIVSNPPYFVDSLLSPDEGRSVARHTTQLSFSELVGSISRLLKADGRVALILPVAESELFDRASEGVLSLTKRCSVHGREELPAKRYLSEYVLGANTTVCDEQRLVIEGDTRGDYRAEYRELTREFYLKF